MENVIKQLIICDINLLSSYLTDILNENPVSENNGYILDGLPFVYKEAAEFFLQNYDNTDPPQPVAGYDFNPKYKPG